MKKIEFENKIRNNCHEYLYIKNNMQDCFIINCLGCVYKGNSYEVYMTNKNKKYVFFSVFNSEDDAYDYLNEIFEVLHLKEINNILNEYQKLYKDERKKYYEMINFYLDNDIEFKNEYNKRFNIKHNTKVKKIRRKQLYYFNN